MWKCLVDYKSCVSLNITGSESYASAVASLKMLFADGLCCTNIADLTAEQVCSIITNERIAYLMEFRVFRELRVASDNLCWYNLAYNAVSVATTTCCWGEKRSEQITELTISILWVLIDWWHTRRNSSVHCMTCLIGQAKGKRFSCMLVETWN